MNPSDRDWTRHRFILQFGAYGSTNLMVWADSLDDAIESAAEWTIAAEDPTRAELDAFLYPPGIDWSAERGA